MSTDQRLWPFLLCSLLLHALLLTLSVKPVIVASPPMLEVRLETPAPAVPAPPDPGVKRMDPQQPKIQPATPATQPVPAPPVISSLHSTPAESPPVLASPAPTTRSEKPAITQDSAVIFDAAYLRNPAPEYPPQSRRLEEEGVVKLKVRVSAEGRAATVELAQSSGYKRLDMAAEEAVKQWRFVPAKRDGQPIEAVVIVPVRFALND